MRPFLAGSLSLAAALTALAAASAAAQGRPGAGEPLPVEAVPSVDLSRYAGRWYEIARLPNRFQDKCACCVMATYTVRPDGRVTVVNECRTGDGGVTRAEGLARLRDEGGPASRLKVRFAPSYLSFLPFVWGDYWILDLPDDYSHALVGSPNRAYLWILARQPSLPESTYARLLERARSQGFDTARLLRTPQEPASAAAPASPGR